MRRVGVVGAGFAGLSAALDLQHHGVDVEVYEARDRVGGRVWSQQLPDTGLGAATIERGAEFVLAGYDQLRSLCTRFGLELVDTAMSYYVRDVYETPQVTTTMLTEAGIAAARCAAADPDVVDVRTVLNALGLAPAVLEALIARIEMSSAAEVDLLHPSVLAHVASFERRPSWRIGGGNQGLANAMHSVLGERVRLGRPVGAIEVAAGGIRLIGSTGTDDTAEYDAVIVALPLPVLLNPTFRIDLPDWKRDALHKVVQGHAAKLHLRLGERPEPSAVMSVADRFWTWTATGAGAAVAPVLNCFAGSPSGLTRLHVHDGAQAWALRVRSMRQDLAITGEPILTDWDRDPWSQGAYSAAGKHWSPEHEETLRRPVGRIAFAGEYAAGEFSGLMEGALRTGSRAARTVLAME